MKTRTNNKIALCQNCFATLTPAQAYFCNNGCAMAKQQAEAERPAAKLIWVYLNKSMLDLCRGEHVLPHVFSTLLYSGHELVLVAVFDLEQLDTIGNQMANTYDGWYREIGQLNTALEPYNPRIMRREGLLGYLCDHHGISTEKNVAHAIGSLTKLEGHATPLDFFDTL